MVKRNTDGTLFVGEVTGKVEEPVTVIEEIKEVDEIIADDEPGEVIEAEIVSEPKKVIKRPVKRTTTAKRVIKRK